MLKGDFTPLNQHDPDEPYTGETGFETGRTYSKKWKRIPALVYVAMALLLFLNVMQIGLFYRYRAHEPNTPVDYAIPPAIPVQYKQFWWNTEYSSTDQAAQDKLWDSIRWTHGMVAKDREWAKSQNWPDSMPLPGNETKSIWLLEAYHEVHCLGVLRRMMHQSFAGSKFDDEPSAREHAAHCFDYLLQVRIIPLRSGMRASIARSDVWPGGDV